jgi:hypothetical protein
MSSAQCVHGVAQRDFGDLPSFCMINERAKRRDHRAQFLDALKVFCDLGVGAHALWIGKTIQIVAYGYTAAQPQRQKQCDDRFHWREV